MEKIRRHFRGDFSLDVAFFTQQGDNTTAIPVPHHVKIEYFTDNKWSPFVVERNGNSLTNCALADDGSQLTVYLSLSNHNIGTGILKYLITEYIIDNAYPNGVRKVFTPGETNVLLWTGKNSEDNKVVQHDISSSSSSTVVVQGDSVIEQGDVECSAVLKGEYYGLSNSAISKTSIALGGATTAGLRGWYFSHINFQDNGYLSIWLSSKQPILRPLQASGTTNSTFVSGFAVGDIISIVNDAKYEKCLTINKITGNKISFSTTSNEIPFSEIKGSATNVDDYAVYVHEKPRAGGIDLGGGALSEGAKSRATNICAHAEGWDCEAYGQFAHAEGRECRAGYAAHAEGREAVAGGERSHAEGYQTTATGSQAHAEGAHTISAGNNAHAEGYETEAQGTTSHAEGYQTHSMVDSSHAEGWKSIAEGKRSHAEGSETNTKGIGAHAEGGLSIGQGDYAHAEGYQTRAYGTKSHAEGETNYALGQSSHAEGRGQGVVDDITIDNAEELWDAAESSGEKRLHIAKGKYSHIEGFNNFAGGDCAHAEGQRTKAAGTSAHSEGWKTAAIGPRSHAEGTLTKAEGSESHAAGYGSHAKGKYSQAVGQYTETSNAAEFACGKYNKSNPDTIFSIGNGSGLNNRSNAFEIVENGDIKTTYVYGAATATYIYDQDKPSVALYLSIGSNTVIDGGNISSIECQIIGASDSSFNNLKGNTFYLWPAGMEASSLQSPGTVGDVYYENGYWTAQGSMSINGVYIADIDVVVAAEKLESPGGVQGYIGGNRIVTEAEWQNLLTRLAVLESKINA